VLSYKNSESKAQDVDFSCSEGDCLKTISIIININLKYYIKNKHFKLVLWKLLKFIYKNEINFKVQ